MIDNYFEFRNVSPSKYEGINIPEYFRKYLQRDDIILDYGCGFGQLISAMKKSGYKNIYGFDINKQAIEYCKSQQINIFDSLDKIDFKFDAIVMSHVLEHIKKENIINTLENIRIHVLKPNGKLFVSVPNAQSNTASYWRYEDFTHEILFTSGSIYYVLKAAGFSKIEFLDIDNTENLNFLKKIIKKFFLIIYKLRVKFWNKVTSSAFHPESPNIFSFEIKVLASNS